MSAECGNVFFRDSSHDLFFKPRSCFIVSIQRGEGKRKKGSENGVTTLHASRGLLFRTHGPGAEICRYTKIREKKEEERGKHFCFAIMSSAEISAGSGKIYVLIVPVLNTKSILCLLSDKCNLEEEKNQ